MIEIQNLSKNYGRFKAISDLNFHIPKGKIVGLLGPNGAGKTTTMKIITGCLAPSTGAVKMNGVDLYEDPIYVKKRLGYLPENPPLYFDMKVEPYLKFVASLKGISKDKIQDSVDYAIKKTLLDEVKERRIHSLSKGFKQRVGIAQAIVSSPELLILDVTTVGLDPKQVHEVRELIQSLKEEHTIILSTHILSEVQATCDDVIILNKGKVIAQSSMGDLVNLQKGKLVLEVKTSRNSETLEGVLRNLPKVQNVKKVTSKHFELTLNGESDAVEKVAEVVVNSGSGLLELKQRSQNLEDIFIQLTENESEVQA